MWTIAWDVSGSAILPELEKRTGSGLIEMQETTVIIPAKE
jgi:hypothetical protein